VSEELPAPTPIGDSTRSGWGTPWAASATYGVTCHGQDYLGRDHKGYAWAWARTWTTGVRRRNPQGAMHNCKPRLKTKRRGERKSSREMTGFLSLFKSYVHLATWACLQDPTYIHIRVSSRTSSGRRGSSPWKTRCKEAQALTRHRSRSQAP
jgi:hypothetical protein